MKKLKKELLQPLNMQEVQMLKQAIMEDVEFVTVLPKKEKKKIWMYQVPALMALAMCCVMMFTLFMSKDIAVVSIDVNPAIEFKVNSKDRVTDIILHNEQAKQVVGDMNLDNTDIEVAVHAIIGKMFQQGYLSNTKNSMLLTVQSDDETQRIRLKDMLLRDIETSYGIYETQISILSQELSFHSEYASLAKQYNISEGKAALINELIKDNPEYTFESFIKLSINDIQTLIHYKNISYSTITANGVESHEGYLTVEELKDIIQKHANTSLIDFVYELDCDDNRLVYEADFTDGLAHYEYEVNAISGEIIDFELELLDYDD